MSEQQVVEVLRSDAPLVLVEAPAGFGKTFQGAQYAKSLLPYLSPGRLLILTHTNAACDVFAEQTQGFGKYVEIRTIDSLITHLATVYHQALGLPPEVTVWATQQGNDGFNKIAERVARLLRSARSISTALAARYPYIICDEHQDSNDAQHQIILLIHYAGALVRIFADPMQAIYNRNKDQESWARRWVELQTAANEYLELDIPHRWKNSAPELGDWIKEARITLKAGRQIDLRSSPPSGLTLIRANNAAQRHGYYAVSSAQRSSIDDFVRTSSELLLLSSTNDTVQGLRSFFYRSIPIWEGHTRDALSRLALACIQYNGSAMSIADAFIKFVQDVSCGFSNSAYGNTFKQEITQACSSPKRGKPGKIQTIAEYILNQPNHRGIASALAQLDNLMRTDRAFKDIKLDMRREFKEAIQLADYDNLYEGVKHLNLRRTVSRHPLPPRAISTIHKAKGLERENVLIVPCDRAHFADSDTKRRLFYVALSRATKSLALVIPYDSPSPLFRL